MRVHDELLSRRGYAAPTRPPGSARAKQLMFTGDVISGRQAADWGLATVAVAAAELKAETMRLEQTQALAAALARERSAPRDRSPGST